MMCKSLLRILFLLTVFTPHLHGQSLLEESSATSRAVVIGISEYQHPKIPDLNYAHKDAEAFADYLKSAAGGEILNENMVLLTNEEATTGKMVAALSWLVEESQEGDKAIIYFSGHGDVERVSKFQRGYLLSYDSPYNNYLAGAFPLFGLQDIISTLSESGVEVTVFSDACHAGNLAGANVNGTAATSNALAKRFANEIKILSCQPSEYSLEGVQWGGGRGVFSYYLIEGLTGLADQNEDLEIDLYELENYLEEKIPRETAPQRQIPVTVGDKSRVLASVDPEILEQLKKEKKVRFPELAPIESKGIEETTLANVDSSIIQAFLSFRQAVEEKNLLTPKGNSANDYFQQLIAEPSIKPLHNIMRRNFAAALQEEAQQAINAYLRSDVEEMKDRINMAKKYEFFPQYLEKAAELLGKRHYLHSTLIARAIYFEGVNLRLEAKRKDDDLALFKQSQEIQYQALALNDKAAYVWNELSLTHFHLGEYEKSDSCLFKAIELAPTWSIPYYNFLFHYSKLGPEFYEKAEYYGLKSMELQPDDYDVYFNLADLYEMQERYDECVSMLKKCIELDPERSGGYNNLGYIYKETGLGTLKEAEGLFLEALKKDSADFAAIYNLAQLYREEFGKLEDAVNLFEKYIELKPKDPDGYNELGLTLDEFPDKAEEAEDMYKKAGEVDPEYPYGLYNLAHLYSHELNRLEEAIPLFKTYNEYEEEDPDGYYEIACILSELGKVEEALEWFQQALDRDFSDHEKLKKEAMLNNLRSTETFQLMIKERFGN